MNRIDYDEDDVTGPEETGRRPWKRYALIAVLIGFGLSLGFLIPYVISLNKEVTQRFGQLQWQLPTRVYGRPLQLAPDTAMDTATLKTELDAAGYYEGDGVREGTYANKDGQWKIASRGFTDISGQIPAQRIELMISNKRVARLKDVETQKPLRLARLDPARIATLYGAHQEERRLVRLDEVPDLLVSGLQAVEDRDFKSHHGIDISGILRAMFVNAKSGEAKQGASTLTQQLARSGLLGIGREVTFERKFKEILYAVLIDARYDKQTILEAYMNQVYLGQRGNQAIRGMAAGSEFWFNRQLNDLTPAQIAMLIGIVKGPSAYDPRRNPEAAKDRRNFVLKKLLDNQLITDAEYKTAIASPLGITENAGRLAANRFPAYVELVRRQLAADYPADALQGAGLSVMTAMSPSAQAYAEGAITKTLKDIENKKRPPLEAAMLVTDTHYGEVLAVVGSRNFDQPGFNRALEAKRPVGSLLKPFVYMMALANYKRWTLASWVEDTPVNITLPNGKRWNPDNSDNRSHGTVRLMDALSNSYNQATVRIGMAVAPQRIAELIKTLSGIQAEPNPSLILGSIDESPYAMTQLYQFLASGGEIQPLHAVRGVLDAQGKVINRYDRTPKKAHAGDSMAVRLITIAGQNTVTSGTASRLVRDGLGHLNAAGKTGTSNDSRDSWFAGWTGDHLAVIWVGNDKNEMTGLYGGTGAMRVWSNLFTRLPSSPLKVDNAGLDWAWVGRTGVTDADCPGVRRFAFIPGSAPPYQPCSFNGEPTTVEVVNSADGNQDEKRGGGWRSWFGLDKKEEQSKPVEPYQPPPQQ